jgi:hypothetical protein
LPPDIEPSDEVNPATLSEGQLRRSSVGTGLLKVVLGSACAVATATP